MNNIPNIIHYKSQVCGNLRILKKCNNGLYTISNGNNKIQIKPGDLLMTININSGQHWIETAMLTDIKVDEQILIFNNISVCPIKALGAIVIL